MSNTILVTSGIEEIMVSTQLCIEKRRRIRRQESDEGAGEKKERETKAEGDNIKNDLSERELPGEEAQDRVQWRRLIRIIDPHIIVVKVAEEEDPNRSIHH